MRPKTCDLCCMSTIVGDKRGPTKKKQTPETEEVDCRLLHGVQVGGYFPGLGLRYKRSETVLIVSPSNFLDFGR
jgi:hypothetical protein